MDSYHVNSLQVNSYFDDAVYLKNDYILLTPDTPVTLELINRLKAWNYTEVYSAGRPTDKPISNEDKADREVVNLSVPEQNLHVERDEPPHNISEFYTNLLSFTEKMFKYFNVDNSLNFSKISQYVKEIINTIKDHKNLLLMSTTEEHSIENYLIDHTVNSTILSLVIGDFLKLSPQRLLELGTSAFLHDIGMVKIPSEVYLNSDPLSPQAKKTIIAHTIIGYRVLKAFSVSDAVARGVFEHHERVDGSGYPKRLQGNQISLYGRIIGVSCSYDAIVSKRLYKKRLDRHSAMLDLLKVHRKAYDEKSLMALVYSLSLYPIGSYALLSNGSKGLVFKSNPKNPKTPQVKILSDQNGKKLENQTIVQTSAENGIMISRILTPSEIDFFKR